MLLDRQPLGGRQWARLVENAVGDAELVDVVQEPRALQVHARRITEPQLVGEERREVGDAGRVADGVR